MPRSDHPSQRPSDLAGPLQLSVDVIKAKEAVAALIVTVMTEAPQFELIASNAMRSITHLEKALTDHFARQPR
jgi:hypothetical protein